MKYLALPLLLISGLANAWEYQKPACMPDKVSEVRWRHYDTIIVVLWYCDQPRGIRRTWRAFNVSKSGKSINLAGKTQSELFKLDTAVINRDVTETEKDIMRQLEEAEGIKAKVINSGYTTAPMYSRNADGTRGPAVEKRIPVGAQCDWSLRLVSISNGKEAGTSYYAVVGENSLYARCQVSGAVSK